MQNQKTDQPAKRCNVDNPKPTLDCPYALQRALAASKSTRTQAWSCAAP